MPGPCPILNKTTSLWVDPGPFFVFNSPCDSDRQSYMRIPELEESPLKYKKEWHFGVYNGSRGRGDGFGKNILKGKYKCRKN